MELTSAAIFLNSFFAGYDKAILSFMHTLSKLGVVLTPLMKLITLIGEKGLVFFLLAFVCLCFARTRKFGVCVFGADTFAERILGLAENSCQCYIKGVYKRLPYGNFVLHTALGQDNRLT